MFTALYTVDVSAYQRDADGTGVFVQSPDLLTCSAMLAYIPADDRDTWVRMGMALHSAYPGEDGFTVFDEWSARGDRYDPKAARSTWRSYRAGGGVSIGTLIDEAKRHGYQPAPGAVTTAPPDAETLARQQAERQQREADAQRQREAEHAKAAAEAETALRRARDTGTSEYLTRKACGAYGLKYERDGTLLVPMRDETGTLWNLQRIHPDGTKRFLAGGRKSGLWHWIEAASEAGTNGQAFVLLAEGYATAASLHEATGYPCAVAFDCGNLLHVAKALRAIYPQAVIVLCADDDANDKAKHPDGKNPGTDKARSAAKAVRGIVALPSGLPDGLTDFNDLAQHAGLPAVRAVIDAAMADHANREQTTKATVTAPNTPKAQTKAKPKATPAADADTAEADRFTVNDDGVFVDSYDPQSKSFYPLRICGRLEVTARTRNTDGGEWGYLLAFNDPQGKRKVWVLPARLLAGDGTEYRAKLAELGFDPPQLAKERRLLTEYIMSRADLCFARTVRRIGWHDEGRVFVLPEKVMPDPLDEPMLLQQDGEPDRAFKSRGTLEGWRDGVAALAVGNSRLVFAIACAFAGVLLEPAQQMGGGFHLRGDSSEGKTSALRMGASVWGGQSYVQTWRATDSALEWVCASRCDTFLPLDELKEIEATKIGPCAYMIANGTGKARSNQGGANRHRHEWRVLFLSTGEISIQDHIREGQGRIHAGQEVRVPDIPSNAGAGLGIFEVLHGLADGKQMAEAVANRTANDYGHAGPAFVRWLLADAARLGDGLRSRIATVTREITPAGASAQVARAASRFALVAVAGEMATEAGLTDWAEGEAWTAALACLSAWIDARGGMENREEMEAVAHVRQMIAMHQRGRYLAWERANDTKAPNVPNALGWRRKLDERGRAVDEDDYNATGDEGREIEFVHDRAVFRREFCQGKDERFVLDVLKQRGYLRHEEGRNTLQLRLPGMGSNGKRAQCVVIKVGILAEG